MKLQLSATTLIASIFAISAFAQDGAGVQLDDQKLVVLPEFQAIDENSDGMISTAETELLAELLMQKHEVVFEFDAVDENHDGLINSEEYIAYDQTLREELGIA